VVKNIRTIIVPDDDIYTFETRWEYDTWNRLKKLTYPDGEEVFYNYNMGGLLKSMHGEKKGHRYDYVTQIHYDLFEDREFISYGNGTQTTYQYDEKRRRLKNLSAHTSTGRQMMDHTFTYDGVGNITNLQSKAPIPESDSGLKGGNFNYDYKYDDLYRLTGAKGTYRGASHEHRYELTMSYGNTGAIHNKNQLHQFRGYDDEEWAPRHKTTYNWDYEYNSTQPHAPSQIGELTYSYDANGNPTGWQSTKNNQRRDILWDEENRMRAIANNGTTHHYMYDASGERVIKSTGDGQTIYINGFPMGGSGVAGNYTMYVNPFMVVNNMKFTKHYYMGSQRVVSKLGEMGAHQDMLNPRQMKRAGGNTIQWDNKEMKQKEQLIANFMALGLDPLLFTSGKSGKIPYGRLKKFFREGGTLPGGGNDDQNKPGKLETLQFFYHPDHLGSSSFITDASGEVYQHVQYFPFGETFVEERTGTKYTPYLYNGKELDEETGLYYYGARYYDPRISMFYGVDPLVEKYIGISSYAYVGNNPLIRIDPDGRDWTDINGRVLTEEQLKVVKVYIFYQPGGAEDNGFRDQTLKQYNNFVSKYGEGSVAISTNQTNESFIEDWKSMSGTDIREVWLNYHGDAATIELPDGVMSSAGPRTNESGREAVDIMKLPFPKGDISKARLQLNTCNAADRGMFNDGSMTVAQAFSKRFQSDTNGFAQVRAARGGVSYWPSGKPFAYFSWETINKPSLNLLINESGGAVNFLLKSGLDPR
jgi:RHS repeat-associated protein